MAAEADIDIYDAIEEDFTQEHEEELLNGTGSGGANNASINNDDGADLYDDVLTTTVKQEVKEIEKNGSGDHIDSASNDGSSHTPVTTTIMSDTAKQYQRRWQVYISNLTWWTNDIDVTQACNAVGVTDIIDIKFYENRANGQSRGFCTVAVASQESMSKLMEKIKTVQIHNQTLNVHYCNRSNLLMLDAATGGNRAEVEQERDRQYQAPPVQPGPPRYPPRPMARPPFQPAPGVMPGQRPPMMMGPRGPMPPRPGMLGGPPMGQMQRPPFGAPGMGPRGPPGHPGQPGMLSQPQPGMPGMAPGMHPQVGGPPRGPPQQGPPLMGAMPQPGQQPQPGMPGFGQQQPGMGGPQSNMQPQQQPGMQPQSQPGMAPNGMMGQQGGMPPVSQPAAHVNPAFFPGGQPPQTNDPFRSQAPMMIDQFGRPVDQSQVIQNAPGGQPPSGMGQQMPPSGHTPDSSGPSLSDEEFQEILTRNKSVSSSAISRAVQDASQGDFASAIETLVTAISLIKQSKIAADDRCKILIASLQDTKAGIEDKSYGGGSSSRDRRRERSRSRDRERRRERSRSRERDRRDPRDYRERSRERERGGESRGGGYYPSDSRRDRYY